MATNTNFCSLGFCVYITRTNFDASVQASFRQIYSGHLKKESQSFHLKHQKVPRTDAEHAPGVMDQKRVETKRGGWKGPMCVTGYKDATHFQNTEGTLVYNHF